MVSHYDLLVGIFLVMAVAAFVGGLVLSYVLTLFVKSRRRRDPLGFCRRCRYDLTGNVSGICPECGTPIK